MKKEKENGMYEVNVVAKRGNGHFLHVPIPFILFRHVGGRLQSYTSKGKVGRPRNRGRKHNERRKGEGEERDKKNKKCIKSWGRQEAAHGLKCREINIKLSLAPLFAANKAQPLPSVSTAYKKYIKEEGKLARLAAAIEVKLHTGLNFTENMLSRGQSLKCEMLAVHDSRQVLHC